MTAPHARPRGLLSTRGVVLAAGGLSAAAAAAALGERDLLRLGLFVALLPAISLAWTVLVVERSLRDLQVRRDAEATQVASGTPVRMRLSLERTSPEGTVRPAARPSPFAASVLAEDLLPAGVSRRTAPPRLLLASRAARSEAGYTIVPLRRGALSLGPTLARPASPLGLCDRRLELAGTTEITVTPRIVPLPVAPSWREPRTVRDHRPRRPGTAPTEDSSIRPYRRGDDLRLVHWRSSARRGELQVREGVDLRTPRTLLLLDTTGRPGPAFESAVDAAASIGAHLLDLDHDVDLALLDQARPVPCRTRSALLAGLAAAEAGAAAPFPDAASWAGRGDMVVLCTHQGSSLTGGSGLASLPPVAGRNPAIALIAAPAGAAGSSASPLEPLIADFGSRGWIARAIGSATELPDTWTEDASRSVLVAGGGR